MVDELDTVAMVASHKQDSMQVLSAHILKQILSRNRDLILHLQTILLVGQAIADELHLMFPLGVEIIVWDGQLDVR